MSRTAQELAKAAFTALSTVVRLCQKPECKTYNEFRLRLVAEWEQRRFGSAFVEAGIPFRASDSVEQTRQQLTDLQCLVPVTAAMRRSFCPFGNTVVKHSEQQG